MFGLRRKVSVAHATGVAAALLIAVGVVSASASAASRTSSDKPTELADAVHYDTSPPLTSMTPAPAPPLDTKKEHPQHKYPTPAASTAADPVVQSTVGAAAAPALANNFDGVGGGFTGPRAARVNQAEPNGPVDEMLLFCRPGLTMRLVSKGLDRRS